MELLLWNFGSFGPKSKFWSNVEVVGKMKIEILVENRNFCRKSKFWSKIEMVPKIEIVLNVYNVSAMYFNFSHNLDFRQKFRFWTKISIFLP